MLALICTCFCLGWEMVREKGKDTLSSNLRLQRRGTRCATAFALEDGVDIAIEGRDNVAWGG